MQRFPIPPIVNLFNGGDNTKLNSILDSIFNLFNFGNRRPTQTFYSPDANVQFTMGNANTNMYPNGVPGDQSPGVDAAALASNVKYAKCRGGNAQELAQVRAQKASFWIWSLEGFKDFTILATWLFFVAIYIGLCLYFMKMFVDENAATSCDYLRFASGPLQSFRNYLNRLLIQDAALQNLIPAALSPPPQPPPPPIPFRTASIPILPENLNAIPNTSPFEAVSNRIRSATSGGAGGGNASPQPVRTIPTAIPLATTAGAAAAATTVSSEFMRPAEELKPVYCLLVDTGICANEWSFPSPAQVETNPAVSSMRLKNCNAQCLRDQSYTRNVVGLPRVLAYNYGVCTCT
jgi:hypothetical protein